MASSVLRRLPCFCGLRNVFEEEGLANLANGIHSLIEPDISNERYYVLQTESSYPYLQEHIQKFRDRPVRPNPWPRACY